MHIAIAGNIGSGKTTLAELLAKNFGWDVMYEETENNPYLNDFYNDMQRWSFNLQVYFLNQRLQQLHKIKGTEGTVVQDRTIYEDAAIFAPNLQAMGLMTSRDFDNYLSLFNQLDNLIKAPDLLIYLKASVPTLVEHIQNRGREYEESIRLDYLKRLNDRYNTWIAEYNKGKLLVIDVDNNQFSTKDEDLGIIIQKINAELNGLF
jgi:deoxyadenosine/deoxycytidine kinase